MNIRISYVVLVTIVGLFLTGCGGDASSSGNSITPPAVEKMGSLKISLNSGQQTAKQVGAATLPTPDFIRIVISNTSADYKLIQDVTISGTTPITIPVPAATGYTVDVFSVQSGAAIGASYLLILKFGEASNITVTANTNTDVSLTLQPPDINYTLPTSSVVAGDQFDVTASMPSPYFSSAFLATSLTPFTGVAGSYPYTSTDGKFSITSPAATSSGNLYLQTFYFINPKFKTSTENTSGPDFVFVYPNPSHNDTPVSVPFLIPSGMSISITY